MVKKKRNIFPLNSIEEWGGNLLKKLSTYKIGCIGLLSIDWGSVHYGTAWCEVSTTKQMICALYALAPLIGRKLEREGPFWASNIYYNIDGIENPMFILLGSSKYSRVRCLGCSVLLLLCSYRGPGFFLGVFSFCVARAQDGRM